MKTYNCISITINESNTELLQLIQREDNFTVRKRLLALQTYVSGVAQSYLAISKALGVSQKSVSAWFRLYEREGIEALLRRPQTGPSVGSSSVLKTSTIEAAMERLSDSETGFQSFVELQHFISEKEGKEVNYTTVYRYFRRGKGAKLKAVRPSNVKKDEDLVETIKKMRIIIPNLLKKRTRFYFNI